MKIQVIALCFLLLVTPSVKARQAVPFQFEISKPAPEGHFLQPNFHPSGVSPVFSRGECQGDQISEIFKRASDLASAADQLRTYFEKCTQDFATDRERFTLAPVIQFAAVDYPFKDNPDIRFVRGTDGDGRKINGYLALKKDLKARPFIIVKCGVFCNAEESSSIIDSMMHLFDESPFHVLILANVTGSDFEKDNKAFAVGGFDEGRQLYQLATYLKKESPIRDRISSVQVMGISLGGNGALFSGLYSSKNPMAGNQKPIDAVMAVCPVVNLQNSLRNLYQEDLLSRGYTFYTFQVLRSIAEGLPFLGTALKNINKKKPEQMYQLLTRFLLDYYSDWTKRKTWDLAPFQGVQIQNLQQFWDLNDFLQFYSQAEIPTLVIAADNDYVVRPKQNAYLIPADNPLVQVLPVEQGSHCAFSYANGYERWSRLLREYFIANDPIWKKQRNEVLVDLGEELKPRGMLGGFRPAKFTYQLQSEWQVLPRKAEAFLTLKTINYQPSGETSCLGVPEYNIDELQNRESCVSYHQIKIPMRKILSMLNEAVPQTEFAARRLTRILNTRTTLLDEKGENYLRSQSRSPKFLKLDLFE